MCEVEIKLNTIDDVKNLVSDVTIMGIFSLDFSNSKSHSNQTCTAKLNCHGLTLSS